MDCAAWPACMYVWLRVCCVCMYACVHFAYVCMAACMLHMYVWLRLCCVFLYGAVWTAQHGAGRAHRGVEEGEHGGAVDAHGVAQVVLQLPRYVKYG
jgi:hypothetical protein